MSERESLFSALREADETLVKVGALDQARAVRKALAFVESAGLVLHDPRLSYVEIQVDRDAWEDAARGI